jgi:hypothetical protein
MGLKTDQGDQKIGLQDDADWDSADGGMRPPSGYSST